MASVASYVSDLGSSAPHQDGLQDIMQWYYYAAFRQSNDASSGEEASSNEQPVHSIPAPKSGDMRFGWNWLLMHADIVHSRLNERQRVTRRFVLQGTRYQLVCEDAPWEREDPGDTTLVIPRFVQQRIPTTMVEILAVERGTRRTPSPNDLIPVPSLDRLRLWGLVKMAQQRAAPEKELFTSLGPGKVFELRPEPRSKVPLQWVHVGPMAIPDELADTPSRKMDARWLLKTLNTVLATKYRSNTPGLQDCLAQVLSSSHDFGEAYGTLRPWWFLQAGISFTNLLGLMKARRQELRAQWDNAIRDFCITDARLPPRRVWDLFSNRVLHFHTLPRWPNKPAGYIPPVVWCISHGWVDPKHRITVRTKINGEEWLVPIPARTSLAHIRVELLNMGAQYVWLDVLCLRQEAFGPDSGPLEQLRVNEWATDLPTIGAIYQRQALTSMEWHTAPEAAVLGMQGKYVGSKDQPLDEVPCVTYFNGLGLAFDVSPASLNSERHWAHRVWTVQETSHSWLPGGLTGAVPPGAHAFFAEVRWIAACAQNERQAIRLMTDVRARHCGTEHDRINGLAHMLGCETLPLYVETLSVETTWAIRIKHLPAWLRADIFVQYAVDRPFALFVSWKRFLKDSPKFPFSDLDVRKEKHEGEQGDRELLHLLDGNELYTVGPGEYCQRGSAIGPCRVLRAMSRRGSDDGKQKHVEMEHLDEHGSLRAVLRFEGMHGVLIPGVDYMLLGFYSKWFERWRKWWVAIEVVGERDIGNGISAREGLKWAVLLMDKKEEKRVSRMDIGHRNTHVIYITGKDAMTRSRYSRQYLRAFRTRPVQIRRDTV
ncbi:hypothetical protein PsYK624_040120 [Phanerochaete sordida]|uniref:Heterokaryon incompatibility domain-containing protein n=1 Tax=Phanerochaete sordida TaxID=48140 RepID=A0A9P3G4X8_9APHY|nr:hypothetical protein PsYK624_040120 [Phanerochaete sordida]